MVERSSYAKLSYEFIVTCEIMKFSWDSNWGSLAAFYNHYSKLGLDLPTIFITPQGETAFYYKKKENGNE